MGPITGNCLPYWNRVPMLSSAEAGRVIPSFGVL
jgi:hypothetical protein